MIKTNSHFGIMAMHYAREKDLPKPAESETTTRPMTAEDWAYCDTLKPQESKDEYKTTAYQRPVPAPKREIDIWEERGE